MKIAIVIPAYNEEKTISKVLKSLPRKISGVDEIVSIVVNDGSSDRTKELAKANACLVINHVVNLGVGAATITGFEAAKKIGVDAVITLDADGQHNPDDIERLLRPILIDKADIVIGTRMLDSTGMPLLKVVGNWIMNILTLVIFHKWSTDSQSGMRAYSKRALKKIQLHSIGYEICSEIIGEIKRNNLKLTEVPIEVIYTKYSMMTGQSWLNAANILTKMIGIKISGRK